MVQGKPVQVNVQKYQSMVLVAESEANNINLDINGVNIEQLKSIKLFGVFLDSELNFNEHISSVCRKASQQIGVLRRLRKIIPTHSKLQLYKAVILPHLTYCSTIWHFCRASDKRKVDRLQERAPRVVFNNEPVSYAYVRDYIIARSSLSLRVKWLKQQKKKYLNPP